MPTQIQLTDQHIIDRPTRFTETLVSVYDSHQWIADLDVLFALRNDKVTRFACRSTLGGAEPATFHGGGKPFSEVFKDFHQMVSVDNWEESLENSEGTVKVVRPHKNWLARLAFAVASIQCGYQPMILPDWVCWSCFSLQLESLGSIKAAVIL